MKKLDGLFWKPMWVSHLGCIKGCLDYLGIEMSDDWLFGGTGHAFVINVHEKVCPSGPTAWMTGPMSGLAVNLGYELDGVFSTRSDPGDGEAAARAWDFARESIDAGLPCYGWELAIPEFYVIYGYDETGYYFSGPMSDQGPMPKPWEHLGRSDIGIVELYSVQGTGRAGDAETVRSALEFALRHAEGPGEWIFPGYASGLAAYDLWTRALEENTAGGHGMAYNTAVWHECREHAAGFLREAAERLGGRFGRVFREPAGRYSEVAGLLGEVEALFPMRGMDPGHIGDEGRRRKAAALLTRARRAEGEGLKGLAGIVEVLTV
jgi:hypothetical protein